MHNILDTINSPSDLKALDEKELVLLCGEIRRELIETVSNNGGHMASNLGVVELTVALHKAFNCPQDSIIFDVGHQCYTHKLLTGRREKFDTLRKKDGISGFPKPLESPCDPFIAGHSSTSLSSAIGLARAKLLSGDNTKVIAVLGDGAFAGGMVYEAINSLDKSMTNLVVVLNDNEMSISKSVGSFARYLLRLRTNSGYSRFKKSIQHFVTHIPLIGNWIARTLLKYKSSFRRLMYGGTLFEELGFNYIGTVDGHDIDELCRILTNIEQLDGPILLHALTIKGKGFALAEENPGAYHGVGQFDLENGNPDISQADSFSNVFGNKLCGLAEKDERICAVTAAMKYGTGLQYMAKQFPERFFDVGIAEEHAVAYCAGLSKGGMKPVFSVYSTFLQRSFDQLAHDISLAKVPVLLAIDRAGLVGEDGETHQGLLDVAMLSAIGRFSVVSPSNYAELEYWVEMAVGFDSPWAVRYPRGNEDARLSQYACTGNFFDLIKNSPQENNLIITYGREFAEALEAAESIKNCDVLKLNIVSPVPEEAVKAAQRYKKIVFAEEGVEAGGVGEHFLSNLYKSGYKGKYTIRAVSKPGIAQATIAEQLEITGLDSNSLIELFTD